MATQTEIYTSIEELIPAYLWKKYSHLSFAEMAEIEELEKFRSDLLQAEKDWYDAEKKD